ncbi:MAG: MBL fold metallo-hydrolase [Anaerolineae bacterium]|nr:MBL fold metallo-hydrolase [Anaerolineae bacterium]
MQQILPNLYTFSGLLVGRVYLIDDGGELTIIDAGLASAGQKILQQLAAANYQPSQVKRIIITHAHPDHIGSLKALAEATGAQVIASAEEAEVIEGRTLGKLPDPATLPAIYRMIPMKPSPFPPTPVGRIVQDGDVIDVFGGLRVVATPGHAPGQIALYQPEKKLIITGDTLMHMLGLRLPMVMATPDMPQAKQSIRKLCDMDIEIVLFGHGEPIMSGGREQIRAFARSRGIL